MNKNIINDYYTSEPNKLILLELAKSLGLNIPKTFIIDNKKSLIELLEENTLVTKGVIASSNFQFVKETAIIYTNEIKLHDIRI